MQYIRLMGEAAKCPMSAKYELTVLRMEAEEAARQQRDPHKRREMLEQIAEAYEKAVDENNQRLVKRTAELTKLLLPQPDDNVDLLPMAVRSK